MPIDVCIYVDEVIVSMILKTSECSNRTTTPDVSSEAFKFHLVEKTLNLCFGTVTMQCNRTNGNTSNEIRVQNFAETETDTVAANRCSLIVSNPVFDPSVPKLQQNFGLPGGRSSLSVVKKKDTEITECLFKLTKVQLSKDENLSGLNCTQNFFILTKESEQIKDLDDADGEKLHCQGNASSNLEINLECTSDCIDTDNDDRDGNKLTYAELKTFDKTPDFLESKVIIDEISGDYKMDEENQNTFENFALSDPENSNINSNLGFARSKFPVLPRSLPLRLKSIHDSPITFIQQPVSWIEWKNNSMLHNNQQSFDVNNNVKNVDKTVQHEQIESPPFVQAVKASSGRGSLEDGVHIPCDLCDFVAFNMRGARTHEAYHRGRIFGLKCRKCHYENNSREVMRQHAKMHYNC